MKPTGWYCDKDHHELMHDTRKEDNQKQDSNSKIGGDPVVIKQCKKHHYYAWQAGPVVSSRRLASCPRLADADPDQRVRHFAGEEGAGYALGGHTIMRITQCATSARAEPQQMMERAVSGTIVTFTRQDQAKNALITVSRLSTAETGAQFKRKLHTGIKLAASLGQHTEKEVPTPVMETAPIMTTAGMAIARTVSRDGQR